MSLHHNNDNLASIAQGSLSKELFDAVQLQLKDKALKDVSMEEKREIILCFNSQILLKNKILSL